MYHCHIHFELVGRQCGLFDALRGIPPLAGFSHTFTEGSEPQPDRLARADVILADLQGLDADEVLPALTAGRREGKSLILLADREQVPRLTELLTPDDDIWTGPLTEEELIFRFRRWQNAWKVRTDFWETHQFLEAAINSTPSLIWYKTKDGIHEKVNDSFCRTVNKTKEQVQGRGHAYIWDVEQDDPACIESERQVMESRRTFVSEETILTGEGKRLLTTYKSPLYDLDGSVMGTVGVAIDVTQERAYEQEIIAKNHTLETLFTTMDCGIMCHSLDGLRILSINRAALELLGYESEEELLSAGFHMVAASVLNEDKIKLRATIETLKKPEDTVSVEYRVQHKNGEIRHLMGNIKLVEENGELFYQRFILDCTAQKLREQKERSENERRHADLVHALSVDYSLVCFFDLDTGSGNVLQVSGIAESAFTEAFDSLDLSDSMERYIQQFVFAEDQEPLRRAFSREKLLEELTENKTYYVSYRVNMNGEVKYYQLKAVRSGDWGGPRGAVLGFRNVDEATRQEMEKRSLLESALSQANRASKAKSTFLSNMSHDIRTPMNAIVGFTNLALAHIDRTEQVEEYLKKILTSGNHLVSLINDVLDMSRIESGKMRLEESVCSLPDILHGLRSIVQADVQAKQLTLNIDAVDVLDEDIYCDKLRLNQVLLNLLSNSVKYTGPGGAITLRITQRNNAPTGHANYEFYIKDTGIGMSEEFLAHIFEPFERERNSTISGIQGTGLGMAITKNIVEMMNGTIDVRSEQGVGTEFTVTLTFRLHTGPNKIQAIAQLQNRRALVVDDDFNTCDSVSYMLQQIGLRAEWTLSGREAVLRTRQAIMREDTYGLYLIDWLMPDMNGVEVARRIQKETGGNAPIIVLTAYDWSDIEEEAREAGVAAFCSKPIFASELRSCLHAVVSAEEPGYLKLAQLSQKHRTGRILLVEDNPLNQEIAIEILREAGFEPETAENGAIAIEMLRNSQPGYYRLILMDVQMPVMDGYRATQAIRALEDRQLAEIPILAMTANAFEEDRQEALRSGMNGHISKPINIENLLTTLDEVLGQESYSQRS